MVGIPRGKGNSAVAKSVLAKSIKEAADKIEKDRWLQTPAGKSWQLSEDMRLAYEELKSQVAIGQLVWIDDMIGNPGEERGVTRCGKIIEIVGESVRIEMLYVLFGDQKLESYTNYNDVPWHKGDSQFRLIAHLDKHVAWNGNIWWKG